MDHKATQRWVRTNIKAPRAGRIYRAGMIESHGTTRVTHAGDCVPKHPATVQVSGIWRQLPMYMGRKHDVSAKAVFGCRRDADGKPLIIVA